jgi:hypothetical protein
MVLREGSTTMATTKGKDATIYVGLTSPPTVKVGKMKDPNFDLSQTTADSTTTDSGDFEEHEVIRQAGDLTFKTLTDAADPGQIILRNAGPGLTKIFAEYREYGDGPGRPFERFSASVTFKRGHPIQDMAATDFTVKPSGVRTRGTQS